MHSKSLAVFWLLHAMYIANNTPDTFPVLHCKYSTLPFAIKYICIYSRVSYVSIIHVSGHTFSNTFELYLLHNACIDMYEVCYECIHTVATNYYSTFISTFVYSINLCIQNTLYNTCIIITYSKEMLHGLILGVHFLDFQGTAVIFLFHNVLCMNNYVYLLSDNNTQSRFSTDGITQSSTTNSTFVQCTSTHLTSFAVLVDTSGKSVSPLQLYAMKHVAK